MKIKLLIKKSATQTINQQRTCMSKKRKGRERVRATIYLMQTDLRQNLQSTLFRKQFKTNQKT